MRTSQQIIDFNNIYAELSPAESIAYFKTISAQLFAKIHGVVKDVIKIIAGMRRFFKKAANTQPTPSQSANQQYAKIWLNKLKPADKISFDDYVGMEELLYQAKEHLYKTSK